MDASKMKSVDIIINPVQVRKIKKHLNKKVRAQRKTRSIPQATLIEIPTPVHHPKTMKKVVFNPEKNQIFEYQCDKIQSLDDVDINFSLEPSPEFKIEDVPDINIADLFENN